MKRILFYAENFCSSSAKGGTEVATFRIASALKGSGEWEVFNAFRNKSSDKGKSIYTDIIKLDKTSLSFKHKLSKFIRNNHIDIVVNMTRFFRHSHLAKAIEKSGRKASLIFMQHFAPGSEFKKITFSSGFHLLRLNPGNPLYWLRSTIYPIIKFPRKLKYPGIYKKVYDLSDRIILLSDDYKYDYQKIGKFEDSSKFVAIPNIFESPSEIFAENLLTSKQKRVLILSRLDEIQKRLSLALRIWQKIEQDVDLSGWHLDIVGSGHDSGIVTKLIKKLGLKNVTLHGWQPGEEYLKRSSILMMTSEYEGLPLSILEAQACGCVPVAFNSYASLNDIISPFFNGVIVEKFGDIEDYSKKLAELIYDQGYREELAINAINSIEKFSSENIAAKWIKILT